ncbi:MAG: hypothetical protein GQ544_03590, partial [Candidatus Aminicenantes bacterium]|nr:hypothetical protein [Candidatus Aminicenantes bacterium]
MVKAEEKSNKEVLDDSSRLQKRVSSLESVIVEMKLNAESLRKNELNLLSLLKAMDDLLFV